VNTGFPVAYLQSEHHTSMLMSADVADSAIEQLASTGGILADLFVRDGVA
jgi:hypothetical protein